MSVKHAKELLAYQRGYELAMRLFKISQRFPSEEKFALTSQMRRSSRSVCMNLREVWAKRRYPAHFLSKHSDCDGEINETDTSIDFARDCGYITLDDHRLLSELCAEVGKLIGAMIRNPEPFLLKDPSH
jgi:four helix bundle protein